MKSLILILFLFSCTCDSSLLTLKSSQRSSGQNPLKVNGDSDRQTAGPLRTIYFDETLNILSASRKDMAKNIEFITSSQEMIIELQGFSGVEKDTEERALQYASLIKELLVQAETKHRSVKISVNKETDCNKVQTNCERVVFKILRTGAKDL